MYWPGPRLAILCHDQRGWLLEHSVHALQHSGFCSLHAVQLEDEALLCCQGEWAIMPADTRRARCWALVGHLAADEHGRLGVCNLQCKEGRGGRQTVQSKFPTIMYADVQSC